MAGKKADSLLKECSNKSGEKHTMSRGENYAKNKRSMDATN